MATVSETTGARILAQVKYAQHGPSAARTNVDAFTIFDEVDSSIALLRERMKQLETEAYEPDESDPQSS